ncbi:hypothetical protein [Capnocytophaga catalasegens]|uniref:Uncharacterized protein n=1 Tax=Capnocytophaga catalasegens TaxID=1004260 RepID=A0AAV5AXF3_9FLAO|nr:hypothetical protein [Capnocytophaga catalasegens]GIZ16030.1 hypothetical protein RCZ03_20300 [Capnocytophaga catalasegens]GJM51264.1 hypothetical protein RCZ15_22370 [Capnocytophaga catalasegens]GJM53346.1 hypothetical protein RCZ16_16630 [Capnocytophaga catalasegens]
MSVIAKLYFDGGERTLLSYNFQASKLLGSNGRSSFLNEMVFNVSFYPEKDDEFFYRWVLNKSEEPQRVKIVLYDIIWKRVVEQHEIIYSTGVKFESEFDHQKGTINHLTIPVLTLITNEIYYTDIRFGGYLTGEIERQKKKQTDTEPEVIAKYYTDLEGNKIEEATIGQELYLVLETKNMIGRTVDIDLSNNERDFEYKGQVLKDDILGNLTINEDIQQEKLKIVKPQKEIEE